MKQSIPFNGVLDLACEVMPCQHFIALILGPSCANIILSVALQWDKTLWNAS